jgi:hypothetical protein
MRNLGGNKGIDCLKGACCELWYFDPSTWQVLKLKKLIKFVCLFLVDSKNTDICLNILFSCFLKPDLAKLSSTTTHHPPTTIMVQTKWQH